MRILFLACTQAEAGAPGYLSQRGEQAADNLAQTLCGFLTESCGIDFITGFEERARFLREDVRWRAFKQQEDLPQAVREAAYFFSNVVLMSGQAPVTLKTVEHLARQVALPVVVDERLDKNILNSSSETGIQSVLSDFTLRWLEGMKLPSAGILATSLKSLIDFLSQHLKPEKLNEVQQVLQQTSAEGTVPAVFIFGAQWDQEQSQWNWVFDV